MEKKFLITQELKDSVSNFLTNYMKYGECLDQIKTPEKREFSEDEINSVLNLLGAFPLRDVFHIVERFKIEVAEVKNEPDTEHPGE